MKNVQIYDGHDTVTVSGKLYYYEYCDNMTVVWDEDGNKVYSMPEVLGIDTITAIIELTNGTFDDGVRVGRGQVQDEMRKVLGL